MVSFRTGGRRKPKGELANPAGFTWKKAVKMEICM